MVPSPVSSFPVVETKISSDPTYEYPFDNFAEIDCCGTWEEHADRLRAEWTEARFAYINPHHKTQSNHWLYLNQKIKKRSFSREKGTFVQVEGGEKERTRKKKKKTVAWHNIFRCEDLTDEPRVMLAYSSAIIRMGQSNSLGATHGSTEHFEGPWCTENTEDTAVNNFNNENRPPPPRHTMMKKKKIKKIKKNSS